MAEFDLLGSNVFSEYLNFDFGLTAMLLIFILVGLGAALIVNRKYPRENFLISQEGKEILYTMKLRLDDNKVVTDNVIQLLLSGGKHTYGDVRTYKRVIFQRKLYYLGAMYGNTICPLMIETKGKMPLTISAKDEAGQEISQEIEIELPTKIVPAEIQLASQLNERYIQMDRTTKAISESNRSLLMNVAIVLPIALLLIATIVSGYIGNKAITDTLKEVVNPLKDTTNTMIRLLDRLEATGNVPERFTASNRTSG